MEFRILNLLHSLFSSFLGPNIHLEILFSNALSLRSSLNFFFFFFFFVLIND